MKVVIVVQARMGSTRLPGKVLMRAAGTTMLGHQIDRLRKVRFADQIVIATSVEPPDDAIVNLCIAYGVAVFRGSQNDVLSRITGAATQHAADVVVRLTADCPLIDPAVIDHVISVYLEAPSQRLYVSNTLERTYPRGMDTEVFSIELLKEINQMAWSPHDREHVTSLIVLNERDGVSQRNVKNAKNLSAYRFTLDYERDFSQISKIIESGLPDYSLNSLMLRANELALNLHDNSEQLESLVQEKRGSGVRKLYPRLGLGSAQFGMHYGRFNQEGVPSKQSARHILKRAVEYGFSVIDTAHLYGESEMVLGQCDSQLEKFDVVTKTPHFSSEFITSADVRRLRESLNNSLFLLQQHSIYALLIHDGLNLLAHGGELLYKELLALKADGRVQKIGVSAYSGDTVEAIQKHFPLDLVQLPINLLDRRLIDSGQLSRLAGAGIEIHARSVFLQGLLLADPTKLGSHFNSAKPILKRFQDATKAAGISRAHAALHYLLAIPEIHRIIVGVESANQFDELFEDFPPLPPELDLNSFGIDDVEVLNPVLWVH